MTIDIKKSWFHANWNKPRRMQKVLRRYNKKIRNVNSIIGIADQYSLEIPQMTKDIIKDKASFYWKQVHKLSYARNAYLNGEMTKDNMNAIIDEIYAGHSRHYYIKPRPQGYPKWEPLPAEPVKEHVDKGFFAKLLGK